MKKSKKQPFLYRQRFIIGYILLGIIFFALLSYLPNIAPGGLSEAEMNSAIASNQTKINFIQAGNIVDFPYHAVQKLCLHFLGLSLYTIKLPSIIFGTLAAFFMVLLLNRWFKSDVAIIGSILTTLSTAFLSLATFGTPVVMYIFWLSAILWAGSKIVGNSKPPLLLVLFFIACLSLSLYTPHLCYVVRGIGIAGLAHPHLRFAAKQLNGIQFTMCIILGLALISPLVASCILHHDIVQKLAWMQDFSFGNLINNVSQAFSPFFSFSMAYNSIYLTPLFSLATVALIIIGALASIGKLFTSRNSVTSLLVIFSILISALNQSAAIAIIVPIAILTAAAFESIIGKWHSLFPENPYAHLIGALPVSVVVCMIIFSGVSHFIFGYHYTPIIAQNFNDDIVLIKKNLKEGDLLVIGEETQNAEFFRLFSDYNHIDIADTIPESPNGRIVLLSQTTNSANLKLKQIITSRKSTNSDRLYIYEQIQSESVEGETNGSDNGPNENAQ